jgi:hypothetical protein
MTTRILAIIFIGLCLAGPSYLRWVGSHEGIGREGQVILLALYGLAAMAVALAMTLELEGRAR